MAAMVRGKDDIRLLVAVGVETLDEGEVDAATTTTSAVTVGLSFLGDANDTASVSTSEEACIISAVFLTELLLAAENVCVARTVFGVDKEEEEVELSNSTASMIDGAVANEGITLSSKVLPLNKFKKNIKHVRILYFYE